MFFYKLFCFPPNLEIFLTGAYTSWCLCSREILSVHHLLDKINACWSTNGSEENFFVTYLRYSVLSLHIFQFILAYVMLAAGILALYPILLNKSASLLNPVIIAFTLRQLYANAVAIILGAFLCYFSGSKFQEFQCFFGRFLVNTIVSYYIICSYEDFQRHIRRRLSNVAVKGAQRNDVARGHAICDTRSENSFIADCKYRFGKKFTYHNDGSVNGTQSSLVSGDVDSMVSTSSIPTTATGMSPTTTFQFNFISSKTKDKLISYTIRK